MTLSSKNPTFYVVLTPKLTQNPAVRVLWKRCPFLINSLWFHLFVLCLRYYLFFIYLPTTFKPSLKRLSTVNNTVLIETKTWTRSSLNLCQDSTPVTWKSLHGPNMFFLVIHLWCIMKKVWTEMQSQSKYIRLRCCNWAGEQEDRRVILFTVTVIVHRDGQSSLRQIMLHFLFFCGERDII